MGSLGTLAALLWLASPAYQAGPLVPPQSRLALSMIRRPYGPLVSSSAVAALACCVVLFCFVFGGALSWEKFRREPATSALEWSFAPLRSSHKRRAAQHCCGPPALFPAPSSWPRKDRALSGRPGRAPPWFGRLFCLDSLSLRLLIVVLARCRLARPWHSSVRVSRRAVPLLAMHHPLP